ncbi:phospholipase D-like domain-containing protein [Nostoc flagelliforme]|uniref:phospholipase D-like domain-containing protein n=1 Tax=Nostoc flagelliforme TaxID=1306274 RepID=UPI000C2CF8D3
MFDDYSIVGSSNFTPAGIDTNRELNVVNKQRAIAQDLRHNWFTEFWNHKSVDVDYKTKFSKPQTFKSQRKNKGFSHR